MSSPNPLATLSLVTNQFGDRATFADVLGDWFRFLGGKPGEVVLIDCGSDSTTHQEYWRLFHEKQIDKLQLIQPDHADNRGGKETGYIQEYAAITAASNPYILFFHADTLPYREGHADWLTQAIQYLERADVFAITGGANLPSFHHAAWDGWFFADKCSLNFALLKRSTLLAAIHDFAGDFILSGFRGENPAHATRQDRFLIEVACERYMQQHHLFSLVKIEDATWTIFHTNVHGPRLQTVRADYLQRKNITPFLNLALCTEPARTVDTRYYGQRPLGRVKQLRIRFGKSAAGPTWRALKQNIARTVR
jgi:hypothetical protein